MPTLADLARMRFRPAGAIGGSTVPAGTGGIKPVPGQTPPITAQANTGKVGADQVYAGGEQGFDFTGAANTGIVPPNAAGAKPWGGWLDGLMGGQHGAHQGRGGGGRASNPNRAPATINGFMGGTPGNPGVAAPTMAEAIAGGMANGWDTASGTPSGSWAQILMGNNAQQALASMTPEQLASWKQYANAQVANANSNYGTAMTNGAFSPGTLAWNRDNILNSFKGWY